MQLTMLIQPVDDLPTAAAFYRDAFGYTEKFRDGARFCLFDTGALPLALTAGEERLTERAAPVYRVDDIEAALARLTAAGARVLRPLEAGPHEWRAVLADPASNPLILTARFAPT
ncbi:VOC family protein [Crenobacter sp. SG2305]|uniref:VOC family protein n=1 Tax=Crenobacter oryzisoli TaxID=3056844 RepID=UPI0025AB0976|nr:VOC family protein [Crenobacter sp. SG2305]MDN0084512.1 VOC family protein [Crenobacter sp. SG2305]